MASLKSRCFLFIFIILVFILDFRLVRKLVFLYFNVNVYLKEIPCLNKVTLPCKVTLRETTFEHQCVPAAWFNNIFLKLFDRHATYCYIQVDLKSFLASGVFFLGREAAERATTS